MVQFFFCALAHNRRKAHMGEHLSVWVSDRNITVKKLTELPKHNGKVQCLIPPPIPGTNGGLLVWHVERDHRIWSCRRPRSARLERGHLWATTPPLKETPCQRTGALPSRFPLWTSTRTYRIRGCLCGCRCTAPGSVRSSPEPTSKDACITFWKGRLAGNASCITSQCECFYFHNHPDPLGIQGCNCNSKILIKQGVNCACGALEALTTKNC